MCHIMRGYESFNKGVSGHSHVCSRTYDVFVKITFAIHLHSWNNPDSYTCTKDNKKQYMSYCFKNSKWFGRLNNKCLVDATETVVREMSS